MATVQYNILFQETLEELFPSWRVVDRYREVITFAAGQMKDSRPLVQFLYEMQVENGPSIDTDLFRWLEAESSVRLFDDLLHNKYINYYHHYEDERMKRPPDTTKVYCPSGLYQFLSMRREVVLENHLTQEEEIPPCTVYIYDPDAAVMDSLLSICSQIRKHQRVSDLWMIDVTCDNPTITPPRLAKPVSVIVYECKLPNSFVEKILRQ